MTASNFHPNIVVMRSSRFGVRGTAQRTGYKVIRLRFANGMSTGEYEDFFTGFVASDQAVWARPVGVAVVRDGSLLVSDDGNGTIWRIAYRGANR